MKKIIIVRHAKSSWSDFSISDFERPLDSRGLVNAPYMVEKLKQAGHFPQIIFSSPAVRARTTAEFFSKGFGVPVWEEKSLYHGGPDDFLACLQSVNEDINCVALFGHNPGITFIANMIKNGVTNNIPTCGIIVATELKGSWKDIRWNKLQLLQIMQPKEDEND